MKITRQNFTFDSNSTDKNPKLNEMISLLHKKRNDFNLSQAHLRDKRYYKKPSMIKHETMKQLKIRFKYKKNQQ